jgi:hypothetical protein
MELLDLLQQSFIQVTNGSNFWFWIGMAIILAIFEGISYLKTGRTLSQLFWKWKDENPKNKWWLLAGMIIFWTYLMLHLYLQIGLAIVTTFTLIKDGIL